jgi:hypothetical protein
MSDERWKGDLVDGLCLLVVSVDEVDGLVEGLL